MNGWIPSSVGQVPYQGEATATADAYTYGAASEALAQGQAMAAWADLQAKQNVARVSRGSSGPPICPNGFLVSLPGYGGIQTCVNQRNVHISLKWVESCKSSDSDPDPYYICSILPRWFELHHQSALTGYSSAVSEAKKMLPTALRELGLLVPGRWPDVRAEIHSLTRRMFAGNHGRAIDDRTEKSVEDELVNSIAPVYDAASAKGGNVPGWVTDQVGLNELKRSGTSITSLFLLSALGVIGFYLLRPAQAKAVFDKTLSTGRSIVRKVSSV